MVVCPNCGRISRDGFFYCRICGSKFDGGVPADYSTDMLNVFRNGEEYMYIFTEKGSQVIIKAGSMDELAEIVFKKQYPWQFREWKGNKPHKRKETVEVQGFKTEFLKASRLKEPEIIPTASMKRKKSEDESYVPDYVVEKVVDR